MACHEDDRMAEQIAHRVHAIYDAAVFPSILAMQLSTGDIIILLEITTFVFLIALLYNLIFAVVSLRKILKRADTVTKQVEQVVLKPISIADATVDWVTHLLEGHPKKTAKQTAPKKKSTATKKK